MIWIVPEVMDKELRQAGFTSASRAYPRSEAGARWIAAFNGVPFDRIPKAWCYASNEWMRAYVEERASVE